MITTLLNVALVLLVTGVGATAAELPDPTRPAILMAGPAGAAGPAAPLEFRLTFVRVSGEDRSAVLNERTVREGDRLGAARVARIGPGAVVLDVDGERVAVTLAGAAVKSLPTRDASDSGAEAGS